MHQNYCTECALVAALLTYQTSKALLFPDFGHTKPSMTIVIVDWHLGLLGYR